MTMPPFAVWYSGKAAIAAFVRALMPQLSEMRGQLIDIDGAKGIALWKRVPGTNQFTADCVSAVKIDGNQVIAVDAFLNPQLFRYFGLPETI